jgi:hypothetical protein
MKKVSKIISIILGAILFFLILLSVVAKLKEKMIADIALRRIGQSIKAPLLIDDISVNLIRRFPLATVEFENVKLGSPTALNLSDSLITDENTLAKISKVFLSVKSIPLFRGEFEIIKVEIKGLDLNYIVNAKGISNFDFLMDTTQTTTTDTTQSTGYPSVVLKELLLKDIHCNYQDSAYGLAAQLLIPEFKIHGKIKNKDIHGAAKGNLKLTHCSYKTSTLYRMRQTEIEINTDISNDSLNLKELNLITDGATLSLTGTVLLKDTLETNIRIKGTKINIGELIKYAPKKMLDEYGLKTASGIISLNASVKGLVSDSILPEVKMQFSLKNGTIQYADYPFFKNISFDGSFTNGKERSDQTTAIDLQKFHAETEQSTVDLSLSLKDLKKIQYKINTDIKIDLREFKNLLPASVVSDARGKIQTKFSTNGILPDSIRADFVDYLLETSQLEMNFDKVACLTSGIPVDSLSGHFSYDLNHFFVRDLRVHLPSYKLDVRSASFDGQFSGALSKPSSIGIDLKSFQIKTEKSVFYGSANIQKLSAPEFNLTSTLRLNLNEISPILPDTLVKNMSGEITAQINSRGKLNLDSISSQMEDLIFNKSSLSMNFDKVSVEMPDSTLSIHKLTGKIKMKSDTIEINNTSGVYEGIDFNIDSTKIVNLYKSYFLNQPTQLIVDGRFYLGDLDYSMLAPFMATDTLNSNTSNTSTSVSSNYTYSMKGKLGIKKLTYNKVLFENISGMFNLSDSLYLIDQLKFNAFEGILNTSVRYSIKKAETILWLKNSIEKMNVTRLLKDFDNFKDYYTPTITSDNLSGILTANFDGQFFFTADTFNQGKMRARWDIKLEKGGIYNYQPVQDMAKYLPGVDNLDNLEFKTINTQLFIFKNAVYVPNTLIVSNKLDASAFGMKSLGEDYSYHIEVFLSDLLTGKSKKIIKKQNETGNEITVAGRKGIRLKSYSIGKKSRNGLDNETDRQQMQNTIRASEGLLKVRFNPYIINYNTGVN